MKRKDREYLVGFPRDVFEENLSAERRRKKTSRTIEYSSMRRERNHANKCVNQLRESSLVSFALETGIQSADPRRLFRGHCLSHSQEIRSLSRRIEGIGLMRKHPV